MNIPQTFESLKNKSGVVALGSLIGGLTSDALNAPMFVGEFFGFLTTLGLLGRGIGYVGNKLSESK